MINKRKKNDNIFIHVSIVDFLDNSYEIRLFKRFWEDIVDKVIIRSGSIIKDGYEQPIYSEGDILYKACVVPFKRITINPDGFVRYCYLDMRDDAKFDNISLSSLYGIWNSKQYNEIREKHKKLQYAHNSLQNTFCHNCKMKQIMYDKDHEQVLDRYTKRLRAMAKT